MRISDWSSDVCSSDLSPRPSSCARAACRGRRGRGSHRGIEVTAASDAGGGHWRKRGAHSGTEVAEREGFEPSIRFCRILTFQARAFDHSATAPHRWNPPPSGRRGDRQARRTEERRVGETWASSGRLWWLPATYKK